MLMALLTGPLPEPLCTHFMDFVCKNRQQCLFHSMVCDGIIQCRDGSDEDAAFAGCCEWGRRGGDSPSLRKLPGVGRSLWGGSPSGLWASMAFLVLLPPRKTLALLQKYHFQLLAYVWGEDGEWLRSWRGVSFSAAP